MTDSRKRLMAQIDLTADKLEYQHQQVINHKNYFKHNIQNAVNYKIIFLVVLMPVLFLYAHRKNKGRWIQMAMDEIASVTTITLMSYFRKQLFTLFNNTNKN